ncbi:hypothetical protein AL346_15315 [Chelatococcus sp. CO-6]|nr:hypothetical protein AL346_15315 [Chelatococcus sp. CO-6]
MTAEAYQRNIGICIVFFTKKELLQEFRVIRIATISNHIEPSCNRLAALPQHPPSILNLIRQNAAR